MFGRIFAGRLDERIKASGVTQLQLAEASRCAQPDISNYLKGRMPSGIRLVRIAQALGTTAEDLLGVGESGDAEIVASDAAERAREAERKLNGIKSALEALLGRYF